MEDLDTLKTVVEPITRVASLKSQNLVFQLFTRDISVVALLCTGTASHSAPVVLTQRTREQRIGGTPLPPFIAIPAHNDIVTILSQNRKQSRTPPCLELVASTAIGDTERIAIDRLGRPSRHVTPQKQSVGIGHAVPHHSSLPTVNTSVNFVVTVISRVGLTDNSDDATIVADTDFS